MRRMDMGPEENGLLRLFVHRNDMGGEVYISGIEVRRRDWSSGGNRSGRKVIPGPFMARFVLNFGVVFCIMGVWIGFRRTEEEREHE